MNKNQILTEEYPCNHTPVEDSRERAESIDDMGGSFQSYESAGHGFDGAKRARPI